MTMLLLLVPVTLLLVGSRGLGLLLGRQRRAVR